MFCEVPRPDIGAYVSLFPGEQLALVLASVAAGNTAARLWIASLDGDDAIALLWDKGNNVFYLAGPGLMKEAHEQLERLIATEIRPQALEEGRLYFRARGLNPATDDALPRLFAPLMLRELVELFFGFRQPRPSDVPLPSVPDIGFVLIDRALLERENLANVHQVRDEIRWMWETEERFYTRGWGYAALVPRRVICWCTAEYVSGSQCGIGIATDQEYERRGVATATAVHFVEECLRRGVRPFWECAAANLASARVAEKVGFERFEETRFWAGSFAG